MQDVCAVDKTKTGRLFRRAADSSFAALVLPSVSVRRLIRCDEVAGQGAFMKQPMQSAIAGSWNLKTYIVIPMVETKRTFTDPCEPE